MASAAMRRWVLAGAACMAWSGSAAAFSSYQTRIPNGRVNSCANCHVDPDGSGPRNNFGLDVRANLSGGLPNWAAIHALDSDSDGFTNGEELGDPCGAWRPGQAPLFTMGITLPGDATSMPTEHVDAGCVNTSSSSSSSSSSSTGGASGSSSSSSGGAASSSSSSSSGDVGGGCGGNTQAPHGGSPWSAGVLGLVLVMLARRRRG